MTAPQDAGAAGLPPPAVPAHPSHDWREVAADSAVPVFLTGIAFGGSFTHWVHLAQLHGLDVDRPRNLAKTVTVE